MATATPIAQKNRSDTAPEKGRRCLVTGEMRTKEELIRFVVSPDYNVVPDLACNLPGRGLWVTATRETIETAVHKNLFAKAAKEKVKAESGLADKVAQLLKKRCLDWVGLARSAGIAVLGQPQVEMALKSGKIKLLLIADDAAANGLEKINAAAVATTRSFTRNELGMALGHDQIVYAGLKSHSIAEKLQGMLAHLEKIAGTGHLLPGNKDSGIQ